MTDARPEITPLIAGNWKMNGLTAQLHELSRVSTGLREGGPNVMICPPATLLAAAAAAARGTGLLIGGQDCHESATGAHTGETSAEMLADAGATAVIVGHSERRSAPHAETDRIVEAKARAAHRAGLTAIVCVGETAGERAAGLTLEVVARQLGRSVPDEVTDQTLVIAYEPVWAIGTGLTPTTGDVAEVHAAIRDALSRRFPHCGSRVPILYGGSVKPANAGELLGVPHVNGALVGGASLKADDFLAIVAACR